LPSDPRCLAIAALLAGAAGAAPAADDGTAGRLEWHDAAAAHFDVLHDPYAYAANEELDVRRFPEAGLSWLIVGDTVLPVEQGVQATRHPGWDIAFQPGRVRRDGGSVRVELPFALLEKGANCTHNGVLVVELAAVKTQYTIAGETCAYFKFDMSGTLDARFIPGKPASGRAVLRDWRRHRDARLPVFPIESLGEDYPGFDLSAFSVLPAGDMTVFGFVVDGKHYRSDCRTRAGNYPFCDELLLPSYSTAKSVFAGLALMRLEALVPGARNARIAGLVDECGDWENVRLEDVIDMATGRYTSAAADVDEGSAAHVAFLYEPTHAARIRFACRHFPSRAPPGERFVYHSSDTYVGGAAMRALLERAQLPGDGLYRTLVVEPFWEPLALSAAIRGTLATGDTRAQPYTGWGLFYTADDIARIAVWLNGGASGLAALDDVLLAGAMQQVPGDRGLPAGDGLRYNNGFWAWDAGPTLGCEGERWVPFMSGYGGIAVVLFPNGSVYYYFSDSGLQRWREVALESHELRSLCA
jgi:hypothetical protein